jgi:hypothetical protein
MGQEPGKTIGFYENRRRREGDEFELVDPKHYSFRWMEPLDFDPEKDYDLKPPEDAYATFTPMEAPGAVVQPVSEAETKSKKTRSERQILRRANKRAQAAGQAPIQTE